MKRALLVLALAACTAPAHAAGPATVDVQVEGGSAPLVTTTTVRTTTTPVNKDGQPGHDCTGTSAAGALERATGGDWGGTWTDGFGYGVERVRTETWSLSDWQGRFFALYVNGVEADLGVCGVELAEGDDVLLYVKCSGATTACHPEEPLYATAPRTMVPGRPYRVLVREATSQSGETTLTPSQGASVNGVQTRADGTATVILSRRGPQLITVTKAGRPPERVPVCVTDGADGACGTAPAGPGSSIEEDLEAGGTVPSSAQPRARWANVRDGQVFPEGGGPAFLRGDVVAPGVGVDRVRIRLVRNDGGRCFALDPVLRRQVRRKRCGARGGIWFSLGDRTSFEYAMPFTTPRGRWTLDAQVRDRAGRVSRLERGNTRVVFVVR